MERAASQPGPGMCVAGGELGAAKDVRPLRTLFHRVPPGTAFALARRCPSPSPIPQLAALTTQTCETATTHHTFLLL